MTEYAPHRFINTVSMHAITVIVASIIIMRTEYRFTEYSHQQVNCIRHNAYHHINNN